MGQTWPLSWSATDPCRPGARLALRPRWRALWLPSTIAAWLMDVQPRNVLVTRDGHVKLADFGVARAFAAVADAESANIKRVDDSAGATKRRVGVPSETSDVDGLGLLLYEMLTGCGPWVGHSAEEIADARRAGPPPPPSSLNPAVPAALDEISLRALGAGPG